MSRDFNTPQREPWNPKIKNILETIDLHTKMHLETGNDLHWYQAEMLRKYVFELKTWIHSCEQ